MDVISITRQLGAAIQESQEYKAYALAKENNDNDDALQKLIGEFNLQRMSLNNELQKPDGSQDEKKIEALNAEMQDLYGKIMSNPSMMIFASAKEDMDAVLNEINGIITLCVNGENPETCEVPHDCGGSCETCGGCH